MEKIQQQYLSQNLIRNISEHTQMCVYKLDSVCLCIYYILLQCAYRKNVQSEHVNTFKNVN